MNGHLPPENAERVVRMLTAALERYRRGLVVLAVALVAVGAVAVAALLDDGAATDERSPTSARTDAVVEPAETPVDSDDPLGAMAALDGRRVIFERSVPGVQATGEAVVMPASRKENLRLAIELSVPEGRASVYLRRLGRPPRYMYDVLGQGVQTTTWDRDTLRRYRAIVVIARNQRGVGAVLHAPVYKLLGGKRPDDGPAARVALNVDAERGLRRFVKRRTQGTSRSCWKKRAGRPARANAQLGCRVAGTRGVYLSFRTRLSMRRHVDTLMARTQPHGAPNTRSCPTSSQGWYRTVCGWRLAGRVLLRRNRARGLMLVITYPSERKLAVFQTASARRAERVCAPWWEGS